MQRQLVAVVFSTLAMTVISARADTLCDHVRHFEQAPFKHGSSKNGLPDRWIELHWVGAWMDLDHGVGKACVYSEDAESRDLCTWLVEHSSTEFPTYRAFDILECYGYKFPRPYPDWLLWKSQIRILSKRLRWLTLDVDFTGWKSELWKSEPGAIRLGVYADENSPLEKRPPLAPLPKGKKAIVRISRW